jgi:predicted GIY-YIG superfamily endonuclease
MAGFCYVYILQSVAHEAAFYVGQTQDLSARLAKHNAGEVAHTAKYRPWRIKTAIAFTDESKSFAFEKYLKTASGRAFAKKRL